MESQESVLSQSLPRNSGAASSRDPPAPAASIEKQITPPSPPKERDAMPSPETRDLAPPSVISGPTAKEDYADRSEALELQALIEEAQNNLSEVISDQEVFRSKSTELNSRNFVEM